MPRSLSSEFLSHLQSSHTTLCVCVLITRRDDFTVAVTSADVDVSFLDTTYKSKGAVVTSNMSSTLGEITDNLDCNFLVSSDLITREQILSNLYDDANIDVWFVNYLDPSVRQKVFSGYIGDVSVPGDSARFSIKSQANKLERSIVDVTVATCRNKFGDTMCGYNSSSVTWSDAVVSISSDNTIVCDNTDITGKAENYFAYGKVVWTSGDNEGSEMEVSSSLGSSLTLLRRPDFPVQVGDQFSVTAGCSKTPDQCRGKFNNMINFNGEPHIPGTEYLIRQISR